MAIELSHATVRADMGTGFKVYCEARGKEILLDEPLEDGGTDEGMNPIEAVLSALGACKCIVAKAFARSQGIRLTSIRIDVEGEFDPDGYLGRNPEAKVGFSHITERFYIEADNTPEEIEAYLDFMEAHCPVMDTLANPPSFARALHLTRS